MNSYTIRFLRPDNRYANKTLELVFASDAAAKAYVVENYGQRALEIWLGDRRVARRVSPAHDARLNGYYPRACRYPAISVDELERIERDFGEMPFDDFEALGRSSSVILTELRCALEPHRVWVRAQNHPLAPPSVRQHVRFSFHVGRKVGNVWSGIAAFSLWSRESDGVAIPDDLLDALEGSFSQAFDNHGIAGFQMDNFSRSALTVDGPNYFASVTGRWEMRMDEDNLCFPLPH